MLIATTYDIILYESSERLLEIREIQMELIEEKLLTKLHLEVVKSYEPTRDGILEHTF